MTVTQTTLPNSRGVDCALYTWQPRGPVKGVCAIYHGYAAHGNYPTVRYLAELLSSNGLLCMASDLEGHGVSPGTAGLIYSHEHLTEDGLTVALHTRSAHPDVPLFLAGTSMGAAIALNVSREVDEECEVAGLILLSPMIKISNPPPSWQVPLLGAISWLAPSAAILSQSSLEPELQYRDPERRAECVSDSLSYSGPMRLATAHSCLKTAFELHENLEDIDTPFACFFGTEDVVTDASGADDLMERAETPETEKQLKKYDGGRHGLLCEPLPLRAQIGRDIVSWVLRRLK